MRSLIRFVGDAHVWYDRTSDQDADAWWFLYEMLFNPAFDLERYLTDRGSWNGRVGGVWLSGPGRACQIHLLVSRWEGESNTELWIRKVEIKR